jgi:hypothetical protein
MVVLAAVVSQSLLDLGFFVLAVLWAYQFFYKKNREVFLFKKIGIEWALVGYLVVIALGFWFNASAEAEVAKSFSKFIWIVNFYLLIYAFKTIQFDIHRALVFLVFAFLLPNFYALIGFAVGIDPLTGREADRIIGLVSSATYHAHGNAIIFVFFASFLFFKFKELSTQMKVVSFFSFLVFGLSILLTFTRGIWLSLFLSTLIVVFFFKARRALQFLTISVVTLMLCYSFWPQFSDRIDHSMSAKANSERMNLFKVNVQIFTEYPLLGIGFGENLRRNREYWDQPEWDMPRKYITSHAHNQFLNVMATTGLVGAFFFCSFFFYFFKVNIRVLKRFGRDRNSKNFVLAFTCLWAQIEFFIACLSDVSFEYAKIRSLILVVWALVISLDRKNENEPV